MRLSSVIIFAAFTLLASAFPIAGNSQRTDSLWKRVDHTDDTASSSVPRRRPSTPQHAQVPQNQQPPPQVPQNQQPPPQALNLGIPPVMEFRRIEPPLRAAASGSELQWGLHSRRWYRDIDGTRIEDTAPHGGRVSCVKYRDRDWITFDHSTHNPEDRHDVPAQVPHRSFNERVVLGELLMREYRVNGVLELSLLRRSNDIWMIFYLNSAAGQHSGHRFTADEVRHQSGTFERNFYIDGHRMLKSIFDGQWTLSWNVDEIPWYLPIPLPERR